MTQSYQDPFSNPASGGGGLGIREIDGRLVAFVAKSFNPSAKIGTDVKAEITCDVFVIDGGPLEFGGSYPNNEPHTPPTQIVQTPALFTNCRYTNVNVVNALRDRVGGGPVVGVIARSTFGQKPWNIDKLDDANPRRALAVRFWHEGVLSGAWTPPTPTLIPGRGAPQPGANPYATAQQAPAQMAPPAAAWNGTPQQPVQYPTTQVVQAPAAPQGWGQPPTQAGQWGGPPVPAPGPQAVPQSAPPAQGWGQQAAQQQAAPQQQAQPWQAAAPVAPAGEFVPPGYETVWNGLTPEEKARVMATNGVPGVNPAAPPAQGGYNGPMY